MAESTTESVDETEYVALIAGPDIKVKSLDDAFSAELNPKGNSVILLKDCTEDVTVESGAFSFYLNGHTLTGCFKLEGGVVNFNGSLAGTTAAGAVSKIQNTGLDGNYALYCNNGNFNLAGAIEITATGENGTAIYTDGSKMTVTGGVTVNGNVETGGQGIISITNGTYNGSLIKGQNTALEVVGGKFKEDPSEFLPDGYVATLTDGYYVVSAEEITLDDLSVDESGAYLINTPQDVVTFRTLLNVTEGKNILSGVTFKLTDDIDLTGITLAAAGNDSKRFMGTFDGQGYTISNVNIQASGIQYVAFFGNVSGATIKDVTLHNVTVVGGSYTAGLVGFTRNSTIENCAVTGNIDITGTSHVAAIHAGGVVSITDCEVNGTGSITGEWDVGGISGLISAGSTTIKNNSVSGVEIKSEIGYTGGIAGRVLVGDAGITISGNDVSDVTITVDDASYSSSILLGATQTANGPVVLENTASNVDMTVAGEKETDLYDDDCVNSENVTVVTPPAPVEVGTFAELVAAIAEGKNVVLTADITTTAAIVTGGITATVDLNG